MKGFLVLVGLVLLTYCNVWSQQTRLTLKDKVSKRPVAFAHVIGVNFTITSPIKLSTSFIGYLPANDTLYPGKDRVVFLEPTVYNVDEVVVTGQISPERVDKSIYKVKTLGTLTINQKAANNLTELLSGELNIRSKKSNVYGSSIMMQGMGGEHVKFLVDGVPVIGRQNGELDLDQMNMQNVDHVEIIEGPMSVQTP